MVATAALIRAPLLVNRSVILQSGFKSLSRSIVCAKSKAGSSGQPCVADATRCSYLRRTGLAVIPLPSCAHRCRICRFTN